MRYGFAKMLDMRSKLHQGSNTKIETFSRLR
jgi:hypothetical protein